MKAEREAREASPEELDKPPFSDPTPLPLPDGPSPPPSPTEGHGEASYEVITGEDGVGGRLF